MASVAKGSTVKGLVYRLSRGSSRREAVLAPPRNLIPRLKVVETVMFASINISNADDLRPLLERSKVPLIGNSPNLRLLIPKVQVRARAADKRARGHDARHHV